MTKLLNTIGNTPLVELKYFSTKGVKIFAKLEGVNPGGSIKDRVALYLINSAESNGLLHTDKEIVEATSGNTGIGLAMVSAIYGYGFTAVIPASVSIERIKLLKAYGAKVLLTDGKGGTNHAMQIAREMVKNAPRKYYMPDQFENEANVMAHYDTTGVEILRDMPRITHFVAGMGTGGTLMGIGRRLKMYRGLIQVIGVEPLPGSKIQGLRNMKEYTPPIFHEALLDEKIEILDDEVAFQLAREVFVKEGLSVGISSGAALWGALEIAKRLKMGNIVTVFPDRGDRYISTELFN